MRLTRFSKPRSRMHSGRVACARCGHSKEVPYSHPKAVLLGLLLACLLVGRAGNQHAAITEHAACIRSSKGVVPMSVNSDVAQLLGFPIIGRCPSAGANLRVRNRMERVATRDSSSRTKRQHDSARGQRKRDWTMGISRIPRSSLKTTQEGGPSRSHNAGSISKEFNSRIRQEFS